MDKKMDFFVPTNDYVFKRIFGHVGNEKITQGLLNAILDIKVEKIELDKNTITEKELYDDKIGILDIKAKIDNSINCDIELQVVDRKNIKKRILFYWSKMYAQNIKEGEDYENLRKSIVILITKFKLHNLKNIEKFHTEWKLREKDFGKIYIVKISIKLIIFIN